MAYTGPGDLATFGFWVGLRAYSAAVAATGTQKCIKVKRVSDNATQDILILTNGNLDIASAVSFQGASSLTIDTWYDQSGNGLDLANTGSNQPALIFNVLGTGAWLPVIEFNNTWLFRSSVAVFGILGAAMSYVNYASLNSGGFGWFASTNGSAANDNRWINSTDAQIRGLAGDLTYFTTNFNLWHSLIAVYNTTSSAAYVDATQTTGTLVSQTSTDLITGAASPGGAGPSSGSRETEFGIVASALSSTDASNISSNQITYWTSSPPAGGGHLFISAPMNGLGAGGPFFSDRLA